VNYQYISAQVKKHPDTVWGKLFLESIQYFPDHDNTELINLSKNKTLVIDASSDPISVASTLYLRDSYAQTFENFIFLGSDANLLNRHNDNIIYYPHYLICSIELAEHDKHTINDDPVKYKLSCVNGKARYHRIENYIKLRQKPYFDNILTSIHNSYTSQAYPTYDDADIDRTILNEFDAIMHTIPPNDQARYDIDQDFFYDSYINLITETTASADVIFISEKTFKVFRSGQLPIWLSGTNSVKYIKSLGFDIFDDIIDHSYDQESNLHKKIDCIHKEIDRLMTLDLDLIWKQTLARRIKNKQWLLSKELLTLATAHINEDILKRP
jgi:hypothetical protein